MAAAAFDPVAFIYALVGAPPPSPSPSPPPAARPFDPLALLKKFSGRGGAAPARAPPSAYEAWMGFLHAVNWRERNMLLLGAALLGYAALVFATRRAPNAQIALFLATCGAVYCAQYANALFAARWREAGWTQDYFDARGVFVSSVFSAPMLVIAFAQLVRAARGGACPAAGVGAAARPSAALTPFAPPALAPSPALRAARGRAHDDHGQARRPAPQVPRRKGGGKEGRVTARGCRAGA